MGSDDSSISRGQWREVPSVGGTQPAETSELRSPPKAPWALMGRGRRRDPLPQDAQAQSASTVFISLSCFVQMTLQ